MFGPSFFFFQTNFWNQNDLGFERLACDFRFPDKRGTASPLIHSSSICVLPWVLRDAVDGCYSELASSVYMIIQYQNSFGTTVEFRCILLNFRIFL